MAEKIYAEEKIVDFLLRKAEEYNRPSFIEQDPIFVAHQFAKNQASAEIAGFFAAVFAWGNRKTIINKSLELMNLMDNSPYEFIKFHQESDRKRFLHFKHRTFNATDLLWFIEVLQQHYQRFDSLEQAFFPHSVLQEKDAVKNGLLQLRKTFFQEEISPKRSQKHLSSPENGSACKRLNMFLRWMVRKDGMGVDFGLWNHVSPNQLMLPLDLHVARVARKLSILKREQTDWLAVEELTTWCKRIRPEDPALLDFALFSLGVMERF